MPAEIGQIIGVNARNQVTARGPLEPTLTSGRTFPGPAKFRIAYSRLYPLPIE
jgi:hypothetical protein